jgi:hypothetical protein
MRDEGTGEMRDYAQTRFDKGARAFGFCCSLVYVIIGVVLVDALVTAIFRF